MGMSNYVLDAEQKAFDVWMAKVDKIFCDLLLSPADCLPDWNFAEAHADGLTPREAFEAYCEDEFGEDYETHFGQFGVGA